MNVISRKVVKARKDYHCDFCGCKIPKGERHDCSINKQNGELYTWRTHLHCQTLCDKIWNYVDPDEGMTSDEFINAIRELADTFYCPFHCDKFDKETLECESEFDDDVCVKRFAKFMETHELELVNEPNRGLCWRMVEIESEVCDGR